MKRFWWSFIMIFIAFAFIISYVSIPNNIIVNKTIYIPLRSTAAVRYLQDYNKWPQWFVKNKNGKFIFNEAEFKPGIKSYSSIDILILKNDNRYNSKINVLPVAADSSILKWQLNSHLSKNPFKKINQYFEAQNISKNFGVLMKKFKNLSQDEKNIYGFNIHLTTLTDTTLVSITTKMNYYPSLDTIYTLIDNLKLYIKQQHATEHNFPMLNITQLENGNYNLMVGIPTNIPLQGNNIIKPKRMVMIKNKTLVTEVVGTVSDIDKAFKATNDYMDDFQMSQPVIPFQQLITDRRKQTDSTKWLTRIFTPII